MCDHRMLKGKVIISGKFELDRIDGIVHNAAMMDAERKVNKVSVSMQTLRLL